MTAAIIGQKRSLSYEEQIETEEEVRGGSLGVKRAKREEGAGALSELFTDVPRISCDDYRMVFITTNEKGTDSILNRMKKKEMKGDTILGVSALFNLNLFAARGEEAEGDSPKNLVIVDISENVQNFWQELSVVIINAENREECTEKIMEMVAEKRELFFPRRWVDDIIFPLEATFHYQARIMRQIDQGESFLSSDSGFEKVQKMFASGRFSFILGSLTDPATYRGIVEGLESGGHSLDTVYVSCLFSRSCSRVGKETNDEIREALPKNIYTISTTGRDGFPGHTQRLSNGFPNAIRA